MPTQSHVMSFQQFVQGRRVWNWYTVAVYARPETCTWPPCPQLPEIWENLPIGTVRYNWPMSAHASQAFSIEHCTDSEDLPKFVAVRRVVGFEPCTRPPCLLVAAFRTRPPLGTERCTRPPCTWCLGLSFGINKITTLRGQNNNDVMSLLCSSTVCECTRVTDTE